MAKKAAHRHRGEEEPRATNGQAQKTLVGHRKLVIKSKLASTIAAVKLQWSTREKLNSDLLKSVKNKIGRYFGEKKKSKRTTRGTARVHFWWKKS